MSGITFEATSKAADAPDIESGIYDARFDGVIVKTITGGAYGDGERFVWSFTLLDDDGAVLYDGGEPITVDGLSSLSMNTASKTQPKALRYLKALLNDVEFDAFLDSKGIDADSLVGRKCQVDVAIRDSGWPSVVNVLPARRRRTAAKAAAADSDE